MSLILNREETSLLSNILRNPKSLPLSEYGMKEYHCPDENSVKKLRRLREHIEKSVLNAKYEDGFAGDSNRIISVDIKPENKLILKVSYKEFLTTVIEHYKPIGNSTTYAQVYWSLLWKLQGKEYEDENPFEEEKKAEA